jgi:hypothetical protein
MKLKINHLSGLIGLGIVCGLLSPLNAQADGLAIDKVYHPYVQPLERELEFRWLNYDAESSNSNQIYRLGYGQSFSQYWFFEAYIIGGRKANDFQADAYELEAKVQLTEQGEYASDWGALFELEKETDQDIWEAKATLLIESQWNKTVLATNLGLSLESGSDIQSELETSLAMQLRYRYARVFEPAVELYLAQDTFGIGPMVMGEQKFGIRKKLHWELGVIAGISDETPDATLKALAEFEF